MIQKQIYDIALEQRSTDEDGVFFDIIIEDGDIKTTNSYETALYLTVGVNDRAQQGMVKTQINRGGWWGNVLKKTRTTNIGSILWVLAFSEFSIEKMKRGKAFLETAFSFMIEEKIAKYVIVTSEAINDDGKMGYAYHIKIVTYQDVSIDRTYKLWLNTNGT